MGFTAIADELSTAAAEAAGSGMDATILGGCIPPAATVILVGGCTAAGGWSSAPPPGCCCETKLLLSSDDDDNVDETLLFIVGKAVGMRLPTLGPRRMSGFFAALLSLPPALLLLRGRLAMLLIV